MAEVRKRSIPEAARRAFSETGDLNGTTVRVIAEYGGISEGVICRHFESKDQLFDEAVVEPLRTAVDELVAAAEVVDRDRTLNPERQLESTDVAARAVMGIAFVLALARHHNRAFDRDRAVTLASKGTLTGFIPPLAK